MINVAQHPPAHQTTTIQAGRTPENDAPGSPPFHSQDPDL